MSECNYRCTNLNENTKLKKNWNLVQGDVGFLLLLHQSLQKASCYYKGFAEKWQAKIFMILTFSRGKKSKSRFRHGLHQHKVHWKMVAVTPDIIVKIEGA